MYRTPSGACTVFKSRTFQSKKERNCGESTCFRDISQLCKDEMNMPVKLKLS